MVTVADPSIAKRSVTRLVTSLNVHCCRDCISGKLASLNRSWQSKEGTIRALGMAGIEPTPSKSECNWTPLSPFNHSAKGAVCCRYLEQCQIVFPYKNGHDNPIMATGKSRSILHTPGDVARYCDAINPSCDPPETVHKKWFKGQGMCTNQEDQEQLAMMIYSLHREASSLLCK